MNELLPEGFETEESSALEARLAEIVEQKAELRTIEKVTDADIALARNLVAAEAAIKAELERRVERDAEFSALLSETELSETELSETELSETELSEADFSETDEAVESELEADAEELEAEADELEAEELETDEVEAEELEAEAEVELEAENAEAELEVETDEVELEADDAEELEVVADTAVEDAEEAAPGDKGNRGRSEEKRGNRGKSEEKRAANPPQGRGNGKDEADPVEPDPVEPDPVVEPVAEEIVSDEVVSDEVVSDEVVSDEVVSDETAADETVADDETEELEAEVAETDAEAEVFEEATDEVADETVNEIAEVVEAEAQSIETHSIQENNEMNENPVEGALEASFSIGGLASTAAKSNIVATGGARSKNPGEQFDSLGQVAVEFIEQFRNGGGTRQWSNIPRNAAVGDKINFASATFDVDAPSLSMVSPEGNYKAFGDAIAIAKAERAALGDAGALVASGGICAPFEQDYSFFRLAEVQSPVEGTLPRVAAPRGGIRYMVTPDFADARAAITTVTANEDYLGYVSTPAECLPTELGAGETPDKPCVCVPCPDVAECSVVAVPWCVRWGNFNFYTFPELVENFMADLMIGYAAEKEVYYLNAMAAASTAVDATSTFGASHSVLEQLLRAAANYRRRHHMSPNARLQYLAPSWLLDALKADLVLTTDPGAQRTVSDAELRGWFAAVGVDLALYYHTPTTLPVGTPSQAFDGAQAAGALNAWPTKAVGFLHAPGTFVRLDGGSLDFGMVRDSSLIATNDFIVAAEQFIGLCSPGGESLMLIHDMNVTGLGGCCPLGDEVVIAPAI